MDNRRTRAARSPARRAAGAVVSLVIAVALYTRFSINGMMSRDEGIYTYSGQQLAHGVAPYASIFDPKAPLAGIIAGLAALLARAVGRNDIYAIRAAFFVCSVLTVLAVFLLVVELFGSTLGGLTAAVVFAGNWPFATDAIAGPDAKTPAVLFLVLSLWLLTRRRWFWAAFLASMTVLVWQPLAFHAVVAVLLPLVAAEPGRRRRAFGSAVLGAAVPVVATAAYFAVAGAFGKLVEAAVVFPLVGVVRGKETLTDRLLRIREVVDRYYGFGGVLFWTGLVLLLLLVVAHAVRRRATLRVRLVEPLVAAVFTTLVVDAAYACMDFQGYPDLYPLLPYAAFGVGGAVALVVAALRVRWAQRAAGVAVVAALALLTVLTWRLFSEPVDKPPLTSQLSEGCAVQRLVAPGTPLLALGDPVPLVVTHRRNPDRFIYLGSGVDRWKVAHTIGGFAGWQAQVRRWNPSVVVLSKWDGAYRARMARWLRRSGYQPRYVGALRVMLPDATRKDARRHGVELTKRPEKRPHAPGGRRLRMHGCE